MARRKQLKGVAGNLVQWCLSRNFDHLGYWAVGQFYAYAEEHGTDKFVIDLVNNYVPNDAKCDQFTDAIKLISGMLGNDLRSLNIPDYWVKDIQVIFTFNAEYQKKYHYWASALGGNPAKCLVKIITDQNKVYTKESGCNVWIHDPNKENRRHGFE